MSDLQIKKLYILYVLEIFRKYSDSDHRLSQKDIMDIMFKEYGVECERKAVSRNIDSLREFGYDIIKQGGYYLVDRPFEDSELRLLIDSVMASHYIPRRQARDLIDKLLYQSTVHFRNRVRYVANVERTEHDESNQLFYNVELLSEAIEFKCKVEFYYNRYGSDKKPHHTSEAPRIINPYQIVVANGRYYLIGNIDSRGNVTHFRVERISDIRIIDERRKPQEEVEGFENGLDIPQHLAEHLYMFTGPSVHVVLRVEHKMISEVLDWLGRDVYIKDMGEYCKVDATINRTAMKYWATQFGTGVEVLEPADFRQEVAEHIESIAAKYRGREN